MTEKTLREEIAKLAKDCRSFVEPKPGTYLRGRHDACLSIADTLDALLARHPEPARALAAPPDKEEGADEPERDDLDDLQLCTCGGTRGDHGGPYGEGACPESSCESFTPAAPAATPPKEDRHG
jgi:hypothetical protein